MAMAKMNPIFAEAQRSVAAHKKCASALAALRDDPRFREELLKCANCVLLVYKREPAVERLMQFLVSFVQAEGANSSEGAEEDGLLHFFLDYLVRHHECKDKAVRFRATQMIGLIMDGLPEDAELSDELLDEMQTAMLSRCQDKIPLVRLHAAHALHRLQVPTEENDLATEMLIRLMSSDTSADVRLTALKTIGLSRSTLPPTLERARDIKPEIRKAAYGVIGSRLDPKWLSIKQRVSLLRDGLRDRDEAVRQACGEMLRAHWLRKADGKAVAVLVTLAAEQHADVAELAATELLRDNAELPAGLAGLAPWREEAPLLKLEEALLLRVKYEGLANGKANARAQLDACLPDVPTFVGRLRAHAGEPSVLRELLRLVRSLDLAEEAGRRMLSAHAAELLGSVEITARPDGGALVSEAMQLLRATSDSELSFVRTVTELISELHDPLKADDAAAATAAAEDPEDAAEDAAEDLAEALARVGELKSQLASCVALEDFDAAKMVKSDLREVEKHVRAMEEKSAQSLPSAEANVHALSALRVTEALLACTSADARTPEVAGLCAAVILPALQNEAEQVRALAVSCLGLSCALAKGSARRFWPLLVQVAARDAGPVKAAALRSLADLACVHSPAQLCSVDGGEGAMEGGDEALCECVRALCRATSRDGGAQEPKAQAAGAQGLCKLLLLGRVPESLKCVAMASALCALFEAPGKERNATAEEQSAAESLGGMRQFVQLFVGASQGPEQRRLLACALVPLARATTAAPRRTAWAEVDVERVAQFVSFCVADKEPELLALELARELASRPDATYAPALAKALVGLAPKAGGRGGEGEGDANGEVLQEAASLLRALLAAEGPLDKPSARALSKWLGAHARSPPADNTEEGGDDESEQAADAAPSDEVLRAAEAAGAEHAATLALLLELSSSIPRTGQLAQADTAPSKATRKLTKNSSRHVA